MTKEIELIDEALSLFSNDESGIFWKSKFVGLTLPATKNNRLRLSKLTECVNHINKDIWNIGTIIHRLHWHRTTSINQEFFEMTWSSWARIDIEHFHIELRSIMDYVAEIVKIAANKYGQIKENSFEALLNWISKSPGHRKRLGEDLASFVKKAENWFFDLRDVRNNLIHYGGDTIIFGSRKDGILFQIYKHRKDKIEFKSISHDSLMFNPNVIYFERYAAIFLSNLFVFLDHLAILIYKKYQSQYIEREAGSHSAGFIIIVDWMKQLKEILEKSR